MLAGMSTDYYTRLERGNLTGASEAVLDSLAPALQLDEAERAHLFDLAGTANTSSRAARRAPNRTGVRPGVQRILDTINAPAYVRNGRTDIVAANRLGRALFAAAFGTGQTFNLARYLFLDPARATSSRPDDHHLHLGSGGTDRAGYIAFDQDAANLSPGTTHSGTSSAQPW